MAHLGASQWASEAYAPPPASSSDPQALAHRAAQAMARDFERFRRLVRRLEWKLPYLADSYHQAIAATADAEAMFKLDFFEYYMTLERALVHLLRVYRIEVRRDGRDAGSAAAASAPAATATATTATANGIIGAHNYASPYAHRFHANLLTALQHASTPVAAAFAEGGALEHLSLAKDLRNRWKDADDGDARRDSKPLREYDLDAMLGSIIAALHRARTVAAHEAAGAAVVDMEVDDGAWEVVPDAMDWEAAA